MTKPARLSHYAPALRGLLLQAWTLLLTVRLGQLFLPSAVLGRWSDRHAARPPRSRPDARTIRWAIATAAPYVPRAGVATLSLALRRLLSRYGHRIEAGSEEDFFPLAPATNSRI